MKHKISGLMVKINRHIENKCQIKKQVCLPEDHTQHIDFIIRMLPQFSAKHTKKKVFLKCL